eukprot:g42064.t1
MTAVGRPVGETSERMFWPLGRYRTQHAIMEMEYWSLRLGFNLLPADWQNMVGLCRYCPISSHQVARRERDISYPPDMTQGICGMCADDCTASQTTVRLHRLRYCIPTNHINLLHESQSKMWSRPESLRSARRIRFEEKTEVKSRPAKNKAPRDIEGNIDESNIVRGKRARRKTPTTASTHSYKLAIAEDDETQFAPQQGMDDGLRYEDVCLFKRVLRKPEKQLRLIPGRLGETLRRTRLGVVGVDESFPPAMVYDVRSLRAARFRFTDKGDVEVFCGMQLRRYENGLLMHQQAYINGLLQDRGFENAKPSATQCTTTRATTGRPGSAIETMAAT